MNNKIDFVITWIDGNDPKWIAKKNKFLNQNLNDESISTIRFRDWGLLKYWFRCVEKFTPWVNKIYLITDNQVPEWINTNNEKLVLVKHEDYIPTEYLPTFNSKVIELFINKIAGLSSNFVYFNDDMFVVNNLNESYFFKNNVPVDSLIMNAVSVFKNNSIIEHTILNNLELLSKNYSKQDVIKNNSRKIYTLKYGKYIYRNIILKSWKGYTGLYNPHMPIPYNKDSFEFIWNNYSKEIIETANNKFRNKNDINHWIVRYYQLLSGNFVPKNLSKDKYYSISDDNKVFLKKLLNKKYNLVCLNDNDESIDFEHVKKELISTFEKIVPNKSSFEK